jgi:hypothetical protein
MNGRLIFFFMRALSVPNQFQLATTYKPFLQAETKWTARRRRWLFKSCLVLLFWHGSAVKADPFSHFGFCVAPAPPACAQSAIRNRKQKDECATLVESYVSLVFAYRSCLSSEMERAIREANETLRALKCPGQKIACFTPSMAQAREATRSFSPGE